MSKYTKALIVAICVQVASIHAADWPQFRGPNRDGKSPETGLFIGKMNLNTQLYIGLGGIYLGAVTPPVNLFDGAQHRLVVTFSRADQQWTSLPSNPRR